MNFYVDSGGVVLHVDPERIFQGSANANTIRFVGAFASNLSVTTAFKLPNGVWTVPQKMTLSAQLPGVQMPDGTQFNTWEYKIPGTVTENYGAVNVQFFVYGDTGGTGGQIASAMSSFEVEKGVPITLPDPTDDYNTLLTQILSALSQLQGFYDDLNIDLEQLQTSVRGLQGEVSGIQIDLEQVHTDLGNRVEKTTLTYSLYGTDKNGNQAIIPYGTTGLGNSIPQYTADSEIRIPASPTQSYYAANKGYVDAGLEEKLDKTGGPINGDLLVGGELRVLDDTIIIGNLTVHGTTITEDAETIMSKANVIVTNSEGAPLTQLSGIGIRTNATLVYGIMYDPGDDTVKLGEGTLNVNNEFTFNPGEGTAVATRADSAMWTNGHLSMWNAAEYRFVDSGIAADNVVTVNTAQQITGAKTFAQAVRVGTGNVYASYYTGGVIWRDSKGNDHANIFPADSGTLALTSDIPTDYVTEKEFSNLAQQVEDLYALGEQGGLFTVTTVEDTYTTRETAGGNLNIADGVSTIVKTIEGSTVKTTNLIPYPYTETTKTANGVTFTVKGDGSITVNGTATDNTAFIVFAGSLPFFGTFTLSGCIGGTSDSYYLQPWVDGNWKDEQSDSPTTYNFNGNLTLLTFYVKQGVVFNRFVLKPMLNEGTEAKPYSKWFAGLKNVFFKEIVSTGKNLFDPSTFPDGTVNGVTITIENEGILLNGTATQRITLYGTKSAVTLLNYLRGKTTYFYSENNQNVRIEHSVTYLDGTKSSYPRTDIPRSTLLDKTAITAVPVLVIENGATFNNQLFKAALYQADTATIYEPYKQSVLSLPAPVENPAYNTLDFQTGKNISQGITKVFDGTEGWSIYVPSTGNEEAGYTVFRQNIIPLGISGSIESICNKYPYKAYGYALSTSGPCQSFSSEGQTFFIKQNQYSTIDEWKAYLAAQYAAGDPVMVRYKTAEVQSETDLNASSDRYIAWKGGSETIVQGEVDNSEYGAENTVTQDYFTITGGTANGN